MKQIKCPKCGEVFKVDESGYADIVKQVRDEEFSKELAEREKQSIKVLQLELEKDYNKNLQEKDNKINELNNKLSKVEADTELKINKLQTEKDEKIQELERKIENFDLTKKIEINDIINEKDKKLTEKDNEISRLNSTIALKKEEYENKELTLINKYDGFLKMKEEEIEQYKDFKAKLSVKMLGETLEQHCENLFNQIRPAGFQNCYFEKDNNIKTGSKGDYIFKAYDSDGDEYVSIMFDMKNEADGSVKKKKNEDYLKELDKDRREKNCEYAVLVSMLEPESELYNTGIVDVSHKYPKMYVVRPQFFIPIITLLRNASLNTIKYKKEVEKMKNQNIDITNFEKALLNFKNDIGKNYELAGKKFTTAIDEIDKTIIHLQKVKDALEASLKNLKIASGKADDLTIKKLTKDNATMKAKFDALKPAQLTTQKTGKTKLKV